MAQRRRVPRSHPSSRSVWAACAVLGLLLARCEADCPEGTSARFDQCQRVSQSSDAGGDQGTAVSDAPHEEAHVIAEGRDASDGSPPGDADADAGCDADHFWSGGRCVRREIHVDWENGDDEKDGAPDSPFQTFGKAMRVAIAGQIVSFAPGTYPVEASPDAGPDTAGIIPAGITLRTEGEVTDGDVAARAVLDGGGEHSLTFRGGATLRDLELAHFVSPIVASEGEQKLTNVRIFDANSPVTLIAQAHLICDACRFEGEPRQALAIMIVNGTAKATLQRSALLTEPADCHTPMGFLIEVADSAHLALDDVQLSGAFYDGALLHTRGTVQIRSSTFARGCVSSSLNSRHDPGQSTPGHVEIEDSEFAGDVGFESGAQRVRVRRSIFRGILGIAWPIGGMYDFGMPTRDGGADPGGNAIQKLLFIGEGLVVFAAGNTWNPNVQGADAQGHFRDGHVLTVALGQPIDDANFNIAVINNAMQVLF